MDYSNLCPLFNCALPEYYKEGFERFSSKYNREAPVITEAEIETVATATKVPAECVDMIIKVNDAFNADESKHFAASLLRYMLVEARLPWENRVYADNVLTVGDFKCESCNLLFVACQLANTLINKKPPEELNEENLRAFRGYSKQCFEQKGYWGINEFHWNNQCAGGCMFLFGALKFCPGCFTGDFPVIRKNGEYVSLLGGEFRVNDKGELVGENDSFSYTSTFVNADDRITAHRIHRDGSVSPVAETFLKSEWEVYLCDGSHTLDIHIPSGIDYVPNVLRDAFERAVSFYNDFYEGFDVKAITGFSWIFSPQLKLVLPESSNILAVQRAASVLPVIDSFGADNRFIRPGSSMQRKIQEQTEKGNKFHYGIIYVPSDKIDSFGEE